MISVVCVYNNEKILRKFLLKSLEKQSTDFEPILLDNRKGEFKSMAQALNYGGLKSKGDYILFANQRIWLDSKSWLEDAEIILNSLSDLGIVGISGESEQIGAGGNRSKWALTNFFFDPKGFVQKPEEVQTLNECLLIVPRTIFNKYKFDSKNFDGNYLYGADYCLSLKCFGLKAYVIPLPTNFYLNPEIKNSKFFEDLQKYQQRLYSKHKNNFSHIYTWIGKVSPISMWKRSFNRLISHISRKLFRNVLFYLKRELSDCYSVLDLGCGPYSPIGACNVKFSLGVDLFKPYITESRRFNNHNQYKLADIRKITIKSKSFDAVVALEVIEHFTKKEGLELITKMQNWAKKKVIITTPNGFIHQTSYNENPLQEHKSSWNVKELKNMGFKVRGLHGWKKLRGHRAKLKYNPEFLWDFISEVSQVFLYYFPAKAFRLLCIKNSN
ncbi:MAG: glycosyltransferase [Promethearchaeota archaeon]